MNKIAAQLDPLKAATGHSRSSHWQGSWLILRDIEVICAIVAERKTTGAAQRLGISQPAVSRSLSKIEERMGRILFHREGGRLIPTADALMIYERSEPIFDLLRSVEFLEPRTEARMLTILGPPSISRLFLEAEISRFAVANPSILVSFDVMSLQEIPTAIAERRGDVGILDANVLHAGIQQELFLETSAICLVPSAHPLAERPVITAADLHGVDYVAIKRRHSLRGALDQIFGDAGVQPRTAIETDAAISAADFVRAGLGVSVLNPFPILLGPREGTVAVPFEPRLPFRTNFMLPSETPVSSTARQFIDFVKTRRSQTLESILSLA